MDVANIVWITTPIGWQAIIPDMGGRKWTVTISGREAGRTGFAVTMLCQEAGLYRNNTMAATFEEARRWCCQELGLI